MCRNWKLVLLFLNILTPLIIGDSMLSNIGQALSPKQFVEARIKVISIDICKGPKRTDCGESKVVFDSNKGSVSSTVTFPKSVSFDRYKLSLWINRNMTSGSADMVKGFDRPCKHFLLGYILNKYAQADSNCVSKKGVYSASFDVKTMFHELFGMQYFYGTYMTQSVLLSKTCNVLCVRSVFILEKD